MTSIRPKRFRSFNYQTRQIGTTTKIKKQSDQTQYQYDNPFNTYDGKPKRWETLKVDSNFQITTKYPHNVLKVDIYLKSCDTFINKDGYVICRLTDEDVPLHRLIATQWVLKPDNYCKVVDHINGDRNDNRVTNLRWTTFKENYSNQHSLNGKQFDLVEELPENTNQITRFNEFRFDNLYFHVESRTAYYFNSILYKKINIETSTKGEYITCKDTYNKKHRIYIDELINEIKAGLTFDENDNLHIATTNSSHPCTVEYLAQLPLNAKPINKFKETELPKDKYWFDTDKCRIILKNNTGKFRYRYIRTSTIHPFYKDNPNFIIPIDEFIDEQMKIHNISQTNLSTFKTFYDEVASFL